ncbi:MAG: hypothetical protein ABI352_10525 [Candidatus Dormibacter sp.]
MSGGLRLALVVAAPLLGAILAHELRGVRRAALIIATLSVVATAALVVSVISGVSGGGALEHSFGTAIPGVDLTTRADSASLATMLLACLAALLAIPRLRGHGDRLCGLLLCLAGTAAVACAGTLVLVAAGVEVIAAGTLLLRGRRGNGLRSVVLLAALLGASGLALVAAAAQLVAEAGSSDLASVPAGAIGGALAVPWALGGVGLLVSMALPGDPASPARDWAAVGALPAGFLVLLRLQQTAGGQPPAVAALALGAIGAVVAAAAAVSALRAGTLAPGARAAVAVLTGLLISLFGYSGTVSGTASAGLFLGLEIALLAAPSWSRRPTAWSAASTALLAMPGGATFAVVAVGLGPVAQRGVAAFPQLAVLTMVIAAAAIAGARALARAPLSWRPPVPGAVLAALAGLAGGLIPGFALHQVAAALAPGSAPADLDAGALQVVGAGFAGGYFAVAAAILLVAAAAATVVAAAESTAAIAPAVQPAGLPRLGLLLAARRRSLPPTRRLARGLHALDRWLEAQPQLPLLIGAAALAVLLFH